jgi:hypothetical protein
MSGIGPFNPNHSIQNNGEFTSLDVTDSSTGVDVDTLGEAITVNASATEIVGSTYTTIQDAVNYFRGKTCSNCTITVAAGNYVETVVISGVNVGGDTEDLQILGDTRPIAGMSYAHSSYAIANLQGTITPATYPLATYGAGAITLSNTGASDVTVTCAGTAVDFGLAGVVAGDKCYVRNDAGAGTTYTVLSAVGPVVTMTIPIVGTTTTDGSAITFLPNRQIVPATPTDVVTIESNCTFKGFILTSTPNSGILVKHAKVQIDMIATISCYLHARYGSYVNPGNTVASSITLAHGPSSLSAMDNSIINLITPVMMYSGGSNVTSSTVTLTSPTILVCPLTVGLTSDVQITGGVVYLSNTSDGLTVSTGSHVHDVGSTYDMANAATVHTAIIVKSGGSFTSDETTATNISNALVGIAASGGAIVDSPLLLYTTVTTEFTWDASCILRVMDSAGAGGAGAAAGFILQAPVATSTIVHHIVGNEITSVLSAGSGAAEYLTAQIAVAGAAAKQWNAPLTTIQAGFNMMCKGGRYDLAVVSSADSAATAQFGVGTVAALAANATLAAAATDADIVNELTTAGNVTTAGTTVTGAAHSDAGVMLNAADVLYLNTASNWTIATNVNLNGSVTLNWTVVK